MQNLPAVREDDTETGYQANGNASGGMLPGSARNFGSQNFSGDQQKEAFKYTEGVKERRGPTVLTSGAIYEGEWLNGAREGYGKQDWPDGSQYEGEWKNGTASGKGKLLHADGDIYEGDWGNDKANGTGTYTHSNGAKYSG